MEVATETTIFGETSMKSTRSAVNFQDLIPETTCDLCICEVTVFCQRFVRLCDNVVIFHRPQSCRLLRL